MKTSIDLPDSLHHRATARAAEQGVSLGEVVVAALEKGLESPRRPNEPHFDIDELGLPRLRCVPGGGHDGGDGGILEPAPGTGGGVNHDPPG